MMAELDLTKSSQRLADMALEIEYNGKTLKEWIDLIAGGECIAVPVKATNGDVIKALFPYISIEDNCQLYYSVDIENLSKDKKFNTIGFKKDWWNAPYKAKSKVGVTNRERIEAYDNREFARFLASVAGYGGNKEEVDFWEDWLKTERPKAESEENNADSD